MSLESLSKSLGSFHISQNQSVKAQAGTGTIYTAATTINSKIDSKRYVDGGNVNNGGSTNGKRQSNKFYLVNDQFVDDLFVSRLDRDDDEGSYMSDMSIAQIRNEFNTGANQTQEEVQSNPYVLDPDDGDEDSILIEANRSVEHKARSFSSGSSSRSSSLGEQAPQFMPYLRQQRAILREKRDRKKKKGDKLQTTNNNNSNTYPTFQESTKQVQQNSTTSSSNSNNSSHTRDPQSALVVTTGVGDLSGQILNTFKRQNELRQQSNKNGLIGSERLTTINDNEYSEGEDDDPAFEAKQIYDNVLRTHGPVFAATNKNETNINTSGSNGPVSSGKPRYNNGRSSRVENLNLITPGSIGYKFKQSKGEWVLENELLNDLSTIHNNTTTTTNNFTSSSIPTNTNTNTNSNTTSTTVRSKNSTGSSSTTTNHSELDVIDKSFNIIATDTSKSENNKTDEEHERITDSSSIINPDTTSLIDTPRLKDNVLLMHQLLLQRNKNKERNNNNNKIIINHPSDVTNVSALDITTIKENKHDLVALLTETLPRETVDWTQVEELKITGTPNFENFIGLSQYLPNLVKINFQRNSISNINIDDVPSRCKLLNLSHNNIKTPFCVFRTDNCIEELNLSYNSISPSLQILTNCHNLLRVNLSHNRINSLDHLGNSRIRHLDLSFNELYGTIDFARVVKSGNNNKFGGWLTVEELDLSWNNIKAVQNLHLLPNLKTLILDGNYGCTIDELSLAKCCEHGLERLSMLNVGKRQRKTKSTSIIADVHTRIKVFPKLRELSITGGIEGEGDHNNDTLQLLATRCQITSSTLTTLRITNCSNATLQRFLHSTVTSSMYLTDLSIESTIDSIDFRSLQLNFQLKQLKLIDVGLASCYDLLRYVLFNGDDVRLRLQKIDVSRNPLVRRRLHRNGRSGDDDEFLERLRGLLRRCCPEIREIRF